MAFLFWAVFCLSAWCSNAQNRTAYWQQQADYTIAVTLNDTTHSLDGTVAITYTNHSPDTLRFLWIHLWPNAYKNDKTAFSEQYLLEGETKFYFSSPQQKGYINRINFTANGNAAMLEDHPKYIDVAKLMLPKPLLPGEKLNLSTPFHVQLPELFSRSGHKDQFYAIAQWFPKIAMYDAKGWHPMPYLSSGEYYSDFGNYDVQITLPENYAVAATGALQNAAEKSWLKKRTRPAAENEAPQKKELFKTKKVVKYPTPVSSRKFKTLHYTAENVIDFAWSADKRFVVKYDTCNINNRSVEVWNFILPQDIENWKNSMVFSKRSLQFYSQSLGAYPYPQVSVVASPGSIADGMEYPMLTLLNEQTSDFKLLDLIIAHEIGHNWLQAVLATNERDHAWMDEGMNTFFEQRYNKQFYSEVPAMGGLAKKIPADFSYTILDYLYESRQDAPIASGTDTVMPSSLYPVVYQKAGQWMELLESKLGKAKMDVLMKDYFSNWQFKHPQPEDFMKMAANATDLPLQPTFDLLNKQGPLMAPSPKKTTLTGLFNLAETDKKKYIGIAPAIGFNNYDKFEIGILVHNYNIPANPFQFVITPMFGTGSKQPIGYGRFSYHWYPKKSFSKAEIYAGVARYTFNNGFDINNQKLPVTFTKIAPGIRLDLKKENALSTLQRWIDFRTFVISEQELKIESPPAPGDTVFYAMRNGTATTIIPQITVGWNNDRKLHPWSIEAGIQQVKQIVRTTFTGKYFLNYNESGKGLSVRLFAGKIFYTTDKTNKVRNDNSRYHFTMQGPNGWQDYTYSNPFMDRNQSPELAGRQIMERDGGFKYRSDYSSVVPGLKTSGVDYFDNWLVAFNTSFDIPDKINPLSLLPFKSALKIFADVGTSASPWKTGSEQPKFLYSVGLHLPILKVINIYYPLFQSEAFKEPNSVNDPFRPGGPKWWQERLTFSINIENLKPRPGGYKIL